MHKPTKLTLILAGLIVAIILISPIISGILFEKKFRASVEKMNGAVQIVDYQRGLYHSVATLKIAVDKLSQYSDDGDNLNLTANLKIDHGPYFYIPGSLFGFGHALVKYQVALDNQQLMS